MKAIKTLISGIVLSLIGGTTASAQLYFNLSAGTDGVNVNVGNSVPVMVVPARPHHHHHPGYYGPRFAPQYYYTPDYGPRHDRYKKSQKARKKYYKEMRKARKHYYKAQRYAPYAEPYSPFLDW